MQIARSPKPRARRRGFTLIELLVVVLILSILMAVALPLYLSAVSDSQKKVCRANMQTIANTVLAARVRLNLSSYTTFSGPVSTSLETDLQNVPVCPSAGTYSVLTSGTTNDSKSIPSGSFAVQCSVASAAHGSFIPGVDSN